MTTASIAYETSCKAMDTGDYEAAYSLVRSFADQGEAWAQTKLGVIFWHGLGLTQNREMAVRLFRLAAEQNHPRAQVYLGVAFSHGFEVEQNMNEAVRLFRLAAAQGEAEAQARPGYIAYGRGISKSDAEAAGWFMRAALQGHDKAQFGMSAMFREGRGVSEDQGIAQRWNRLACELEKKTPDHWTDRPPDMTPEQTAEAQRLAREWGVGGKVTTAKASPLCSRIIQRTTTRDCRLRRTVYF